MQNEENNDILGKALMDFLHNREPEDVEVSNDLDHTDPYPIDYFFRDYNSLPDLEKTALKYCEGKVLDIGAGAGVHSLILQEQGFEVRAIDRSEKAFKVMRYLGVEKCRQMDFFDIEGERYDTLLLLMNGIGIVGKINRLTEFFEKAKKMLHPGGQIILDSTDIEYMYTEQDESIRIDNSKDYYGEIEYTMKYKGETGKPFPWLFIDFRTLCQYAKKNGFTCDILDTEGKNHYLAKLIFRA
ncbi:class I SAM-dependent methyltransferase [Salibacter sp.]|uniref:class I SAM-dependent methyltransferase n=1 Tax=Salibacter sp. TaxID=2010995 RepID=UPI00286FE617|nr:class I SAM-dependent methyltransferase [Salibacter sp.]MDR9397570.1 class I SAM-dependent methyltransferase [Salibacter sp.]MDR9486986.1 class I SAM-dependent methyltransferase [Salibacter sp.]